VLFGRCTAHRYGIGTTEIDDFQVVLEGMTRPEDQPALHFWRAHPDEWQRMDGEKRLAFAIRYANAMAEAFELVIANHFESRTPIVLEGDFLLGLGATAPARWSPRPGPQRPGATSRAWRSPSPVLSRPQETMRRG